MTRDHLDVVLFNIREAKRHYSHYRDVGEMASVPDVKEIQAAIKDLGDTVGTVPGE